MLHASERIGQTNPPQHGARYDAEKTEDEAKEIGGDHKGELGEEGDEEEDDERIGNSDEEGGDIIAQERALLSRRFVHLPRRVRAEGVDAEEQQQARTHDFEPEDIFWAVDEIHDE